jgi:hypothetical protein
MLRDIAMSKAGTENLRAYAYRMAFAEVWDTATARYPKLFRLTKSERSHAAWLWDNRVAIVNWHRLLPAHTARRYNHPSTIWRANPLHVRRPTPVPRQRPLLEWALPNDKALGKATRDDLLPIRRFVSRLVMRLQPGQTVEELGLTSEELIALYN